MTYHSEFDDQAVHQHLSKHFSADYVCYVSSLLLSDQHPSVKMWLGELFWNQEALID